MLQEIDQHESPLLWVLVHENYFDDTLVRSFQADFHRPFQAPSFSTVSGHSCRCIPEARIHSSSKRARTAILCDFNRSMQHLISNYREEDVENEVPDEDLLHRN